MGNSGEFPYVIYDCKDWKNGVCVGVVDQALEMMRDVGAQKAALIVNGRISSGALKKAEHKGIKVFNIIDPKDKRVRPYLWVNVLTHFIWLQRFRYRLIFANQEHQIFGDPNLVYVQEDMNIVDLVKKLWNNGIFKKDKGIHTYSWKKFCLVKAVKLGILAAPSDEILIEYEIIKKSFISKANIVQGVGLYDVLKQEFIPSSNEISFGPLSLEDIVSNGKEVNKSSKIPGIAFEGFSLHRF